MDQSLLRELAQLRVMARKQLNLAIDLERFVADREWSRDILRQIEDADDAELVLLSLSVRSKLGLLTMAAAPEPAPAPLPAPVIAEAAGPAPSKYKFGARS